MKGKLGAHQNLIFLGVFLMMTVLTAGNIFWYFSQNSDAGEKVLVAAQGSACGFGEPGEEVQSNTNVNADTSTEVVSSEPVVAHIRTYCTVVSPDEVDSAETNPTPEPVEDTILQEEPSPELILPVDSEVQAIESNDPVEEITPDQESLDLDVSVPESLEIEPVNNEPVEFTDTNFEAVIRDAIGKSEGPVFPSDMEAITFLKAADLNIKDINGLEHCVNLISLNLRDNLIVDITPLANLTSLNHLVLSENYINDISALANLGSLNGLYLRGNSIRDITPLGNLTNLSKLYLWVNHVNDISILVDNNVLGTGDTLNLEGNPLNTPSLNESIPQLQERGVAVVW